MNNPSLNEQIKKLSSPQPRRHQYDLTNLADCVVRHLDDGIRRSCRLVSSRRRLGKMIVELDIIAENGAGPTVQRYVGKVYKTDHGRDSFDASQQLWRVGFRPPSPFTVVRPITYIADQRLLLEEPAPGRSLTDILLGYQFGDAFRRTASWLATLQGSAVDASSRLDQVGAAVDRFGRELSEVLPQQARRVDRLKAHALTELESQHLTPLVPSHGDFNSSNVFISDDGCVTVIDLDTFGLQERVADVAYFLVQTAIIGFFNLGSFAATAPQRESFLRAYLERVPSIPGRRLALYMGMAFLQSLHYELCVFHTNNAAIIDLWLANCERGLVDGEVKLPGDSFNGLLNV